MIKKSSLPGLSLILFVALALIAIVGLSFNISLLAGEKILDDPRGDLKACYKVKSSCSSCSVRPPVEEMGDELPFIDIVAASVEKSRGGNPLLVMKLHVAGSIPSSPDLLTSYSFALDLDGDPDTGFKANRPPLGVFPDLGVDLWTNISLNRGVEDYFVFIGSHKIKNLNDARGLLEVSFSQGRKTIALTIPIKPLERKLTFAYLHKKPQFTVELEKIDWVAFATRTTSHYPDENPICDFLPDKYFQESPEGCLISPLL